MFIHYWRDYGGLCLSTMFEAVQFYWTSHFWSFRDGFHIAMFWYFLKMTTSKGRLFIHSLFIMSITTVRDHSIFHSDLQNPKLFRSLKMYETRIQWIHKSWHNVMKNPIREWFHKNLCDIMRATSCHIFLCYRRPLVQRWELALKIPQSHEWLSDDLSLIDYSPSAARDTWQQDSLHVD